MWHSECGGLQWNILSLLYRFVAQRSVTSIVVLSMATNGISAWTIAAVNPKLENSLVIIIWKMYSTASLSLSLPLPNDGATKPVNMYLCNVWFKWNIFYLHNGFYSIDSKVCSFQWNWILCVQFYHSFNLFLVFPPIVSQLPSQLTLVGNLNSFPLVSLARFYFCICNSPAPPTLRLVLYWVWVFVRFVGPDFI